MQVSAVDEHCDDFGEIHEDEVDVFGVECFRDECVENVFQSLLSEQWT